jgi:23S rRNA pseudouridine2457 synthase
MQPGQHRYFLIHKPRNMVSQFVSSHTVRLLGELNFDFPEGIHAIGRLDNHSEGLLLLTTNKRVTKLLFQGDVPHSRTYLVQVKYAVSEATLDQLRQGVRIRIKGGEFYTTPPCDVQLVTDPGRYIADPDLEKPYHPSSWLTITLTEGKFHQVRKMVSAVRHSCIRLIRISIENLTLGDLPSGGVMEIAEEEFFERLCISHWRTG